MKILLIIFILNIIKIIYSSTVVFDNSIINTCTKITPCDLGTNKVWQSNNIPTDGDDIVIDFSTLDKGQEQGIYLVANGLDIVLSSFYLNGASDNGYSTVFNLQDSNLVITSGKGSFEIVYANATINQSTQSSKNQIQVNNFITNEANLIIDGYADIQASNLTIDNLGGSNIQTIIQGNSIVNATQWANFTSPIYHSSNDLLALTGNGLILNTFTSTGTVQIHNITVSSLSLNVTFNSLFLDAFMVITATSSIVNVNQLEFNYDRHAIYIGYSSSLNINQTINGLKAVDGIKIIILGTLLLPSGFTISNIYPFGSGYLMSGRIVIKDSSLTTLLSQINEQQLDIQTPGNLTINNSTLSTVTLTSSSSILNIASNSTIYYLENSGTTNVPKGVSLILQYEAISNIMNLNGGYLLARTEYFGTIINVLNNAILYTKGYVFANIINSNSITNFASYQTTKSINIQNGTFSLNSPGLTVNGSLALGGPSQLKLYFLGYNNKLYPAINTDSVSISPSTSLYIETQYIDSYPQNNDKIYLFNATDTSNCNIDHDAITFASFGGSTFKSKLDYKVIKDNQGNVYIEFKRNNTVLIVVLCVVIPVVLIAAIILVIALKRRRSNHHERVPLNRNHSF